MDIRFTGSIIEAVQFVLQLAQGTLLVCLKGAADPTVKTPIDRPQWYQFEFFGQITALPIVQTERVEPTQETEGSWKLKRTINFFHYGHLIAVTDLVGEKGDRNWEDDILNWSWWAVTRIGYFQSYEGKMLYPPQDWRKFEIELPPKPNFRGSSSDELFIWDL